MPQHDHTVLKDQKKPLLIAAAFIAVFLGLCVVSYATETHHPNVAFVAGVITALYIGAATWTYAGEDIGHFIRFLNRVRANRAKTKPLKKGGSSK